MNAKNPEFLSLHDSRSANSGKQFNPGTGQRKIEMPSIQDNNSYQYDPKKPGKYDDDNYIPGDEKEDTNLENKYWYRGELMQLVPDVMKELENIPEVVIEQKIELLEILTGCETANRYNVYCLDKDKNKKFLLKCKESSSWCCRNCVPSNDRSFTLSVIHIRNSNKKVDYKKTIADFSRPYQFTCGCLCRPKMIAYYGDNTEEEHNGSDRRKKIKDDQKNMGEIEEKFSCGPSIDIKDDEGIVRYKILADYCQCGYCFRFASLGKCYEVDFWIYEADADPKTAKPVGNIHKVFKGLSELITDSDAYILTFPKSANALDRLLLIGGVIMIDYRYYEEIALFDCGNII